MSSGRGQRGQVVVIDPEGGLVPAVADALPSGFELIACSSLDAALDLLRDHALDLVVAGLPDEAEAAATALATVRRDASLAKWVFVSMDASAERVAAARGAGALDCLAWPLVDTGLSALARDVAENRDLKDENHRLTSTLRTMEDCRQFVQCLDPGKLYRMALDLMLDVTGRERGIAIFKREGVPQGAAIALRGFEEEPSSELCHALLEEKPIDLDGGYRGLEVLDHGPLHEALRQVGVEARDVTVAALQGEEAEAGLICVFDEGRVFSAVEIEQARIVASHAEAALRNAETYSQAKDRAFIDDVTEVYNARYLLATAENEIQRAERYGNPLSVLFLDLDRFKLVNDRYGHLIGSETLRRLSKLLGHCVRQVDTLARYGGDEFTILLVDTAHEAAMAIAERIRATVENETFELGREARLQLTISIGVSTCPEHGASRDRLLDSADKAMYRAKSEGRNRVCSAGELPEGGPVGGPPPPARQPS
jgi:diguanylate cyclase (GGDEF)-like protein